MAHHRANDRLDIRVRLRRVGEVHAVRCARHGLKQLVRVVDVPPPQFMELQPKLRLPCGVLVAERDLLVVSKEEHRSGEPLRHLDQSGHLFEERSRDLTTIRHCLGRLGRTVVLHDLIHAPEHHEQILRRVHRTVVLQHPAAGPRSWATPKHIHRRRRTLVDAPDIVSHPLQRVNDSHVHLLRLRLGH